MSQMANQPPAPEGPPVNETKATTTKKVQAGQGQSGLTRETTTTSTNQITPPRRGLFRWILIPLAIVGVGFVGYRLGQTGTNTSAGGAGGFGTGSTGTAGAGSRNGAASSTGAGNRAGSATGSNAAGNGTTGGATAGSTTNTSGAASASSGNGTRSRTGAGAGSSFRGSGVVTPVQAAEAKAGTLTTERRLTGTVSATQTASVSAQTSGTVTDVLKNVGDTVASGQSVLTLSNKDLTTSVQNAQNSLESAQAQLRSQQEQLSANTASLQQAINSAQLSLQNAESTYAAQQQLYAIGAVAKATLDAQAVQVQQARASLVTAQTNLASTNRSNQNGLTTAQLNVQKAQIALNQARDAASATRVTAPFDGQITAMNVVGGQYLGANTAAFTLVSNQQQVKVNVPATEADSVPVGAALTLVVGQEKYPLKVTQNTLNATGGSVPVTAKFLGSQPIVGTVGSVVYTAKVASGVLVPSTALQVDGTTTYVFTVENGKAKQHTVSVLGQAGTQSAVSGLDAGSQVIGQPPTGLLDGSSVTTASAGSTRDNAGGAGGPPPGGMP